MTSKNSDIDRRSKILQLARLKSKNELARQQQMINENLVADMGVMKNGGELPKLTLGNNIMPPEDPLPNIDFSLPTPFSDEVDAFDLRPYEDVSASSINPQSDLVDTSDFQIDDTTVSETPETGMSTADKIAAGLKAASLVGSGIDALRKPEKEKLQLPDYNKGNQYVEDMSMDFAPQLAEINRGATKAVQSVSDQVGGIGQRSSRVASILARAGQNAAQTQLSQQQANNALKMNLAQRSDRQSEMNAQERIRQQDAQSRNTAAARLAGRKFMQDLSTVGSEINKLQYAKDQMKNLNENQKKTTMFGLAMLAQKNPNFKPSKAFVDYMTTGKGDFDSLMGEVINFFQ